MQRDRDKIKDALCIDAGLGILRINANYVTRRYRGISVLRWIIEVTELEKWFYKAQFEGSVPWDEPFDAAMIMTDGSGRRWPYWLSVSATQSINSFIAATEPKSCKGWQGIIGEDEEKNLHELSFLWFGDRIIWAKTAIRMQNFQFPSYDLLGEIATCELAMRLSKFRRGEAEAITAGQFLRAGIQPTLEQAAEQQMKQKRSFTTTERRLFEAVDLGRMEARMHAVAAIKLLVELAKDKSVDVETRIKCANDVLNRAYGKVATPGDWQRVEVAITTAPVDEVAVRIAAASVAANQMSEVDRYVGKVPPDEWPEWLREQMGEAGIKAYRELVNEATKPGIRLS